MILCFCDTGARVNSPWYILVHAEASLLPWCCFGSPKFLLSMYREVVERSCVDTGNGESLVPPYTRGRVSDARGPG
jgi:hypothetical protein